MFNMEVHEILSSSLYALPVAAVLVLALLVFLFGFKKAAEPEFIVETDDRKKKTVKPKSKVHVCRFSCLIQIVDC